MKIRKLFRPFVAALTVAVCTGCGGHSHAAHEEDGHAGHNHAAEQHDHAAEGHQHGDEAHSHATESHRHGAEAHEHETDLPAHAEAAHRAGEIVLTPAQAEAAGVVVSELTAKPFRQVIPVSGEIVSAQGEESLVVANVAGMVHFNKPLTDGMHVAKGTPLFTISSRNMAEGNPVERARIAYEAAQQEYERAVKLVESKIVSEKEFIRIRENYENARLTYEALAANRTAGKRGSSVNASIDGYVKNCLVSEGDYVSVGQPLMSIACNCRIYLRADVPEKHYASLGQIRSANFRTSYNNKVYTLDELNGRLLSYGHTTGERSFYLPMTFEMDNRAGLIPGSYAEVWLLSDEMPDVLSVPYTALTEEQGTHFVYVQLDAECYERREVRLGADNGREVLLLSGVHPGERIVTEGAYQVRLASASKAIPGHSHEH